MILPNRDEFAAMIKANDAIPKRIVRNLRYVPEEIIYFESRDFLTVFDKAGREGVLLYKSTLLVVSRMNRKPNASGRIESVICDICATWQRGTASAILTIRRSAEHTSSYLVCEDLNCSLHVRNLTDAAVLSRTQLRENITPEDRIRRLNERLSRIVAG